MSEYESGRHEGVRRALEAASATVGSIAKRKREAERGPIDDATFQYASGLVNGAREVLRCLEELAEDLHLHEARTNSNRE